MKLHILGICGTFMSGIAILAKKAGHDVTGSDMNVYPPMSTQLREQGITLVEGYEPDTIPNDIDCVVVGNVVSRGNPAIEYVLDQQIPYISGPQWLYENVMRARWVLAVSGTHGKTTTTSMLAWVLEYAGLKPGFLIGGVPENFGVSARLGESDYFVIEADEYDAAFFDKRSKFIHYHPKTCIINNLEYDHADIFDDLEAIQRQFHYFVRTVPGNGQIIRLAMDDNIDHVLAKGCWSPKVTFGEQGEWQAKLLQADGSEFEVLHQQKSVATVTWSLLGMHNVNNALAAIAAAKHIGVEPDVAAKGLSEFKNVKRRLEVKAKVKGVTVYDDFAHHPTAIATTLAGLRASVGAQRIIAVLEFGSYTMRSGVHKDRVCDSLVDADVIMCKRTQTDWGLDDMLAKSKKPTYIYDDVDDIVSNIVPMLQSGDHVLVMSNSGFGGVHEKLINTLEQDEVNYASK